MTASRCHLCDPDAQGRALASECEALLLSPGTSQKKLKGNSDCKHVFDTLEWSLPIPGSVEEYIPQPLCP